MCPGFRKVAKYFFDCSDGKTEKKNRELREAQTTNKLRNDQTPDF